jgi:hypothetical protein
MEILNISILQNVWGKRNADAKGVGSQNAETIERGKVVIALCQRMSKSELTVVESGTKTTEACAKRRNTNGGGKD